MKPLLLILFILPMSFLGVVAQCEASCPLPDPFDWNLTYAYTLHVSPGGSDSSGTGSVEKPYATLTQAARNARPGTDIVLHSGTYSPGTFIANLQGSASEPIRIRGESPDQRAVIAGSGGGIQLTDPRYLVLENLVIEGSTTNGLNIDDGGTYDSPAEYVILRNITVRNMNASGNNDGIKLSGLDHFRIERCAVLNPGKGGSAIDMVGCHDGLICHNQIQDCQTSGIQAKGGCARIQIYANVFDQAGMRPINMGGSTGMPYFRPLDAPYEAANITAWGNLFLGGETPVAFVGCEKGLFVHNTVILPKRWAARILQENNDAQLIQCRNNIYANNIIVFDANLSTFVNVGPNTHSDTFVFANNLWFDQSTNQFDGPDLPVRESNSIIQKNPLFSDSAAKDYHLQPKSPTIGAGGNLPSIADALGIDVPALGDHDEQCWNDPPSVGAFEGNPKTALQDWSKME